MNSSFDQNERDGQKKSVRMSTAQIGLVIVFLCLLIMNTRGLQDREGDSFLGDRYLLGTKFDASYGFGHGWPLVWLKSEQRITSSISSISEVQQLQNEVRYAWPFNSTPLQVHWQFLAINVAVAVLILALVFFTIKVRSRKRQGIRFSLLELSLLMLFASFAVANFQHHRRLGEREKATAVTLSEGRNFIVMRHKWNGPAWLSALIGQPKFLDVCRHVDQVSFRPSDFDDQLSQELTAFPYVRDVRLTGDPTMKQLEILSQLQRINKIHVTDVGTEFRMQRFAFKGLGVTDNMKAIVAARRFEKIGNTGEPVESRIQKLNASFPNVTELKIDSSDAAKNRWPRVFDLLGCCPNLERVSLTGNQFIPDDLLGLPESIEEIEHGFRLIGSQLDDLQLRFPNANIKQALSMKIVKHWSGVAWDQAINQVNRRRKRGWEDSRFEPGVLDLSLTDTDSDFLEEISSVFPTVGTIIFGNFDSNETAMELVKQCSYVLNIETNGVELTFEEAMQLPSGIDRLEIMQASITAEEFVTLINRKMPQSLTISCSTFTEQEKALIREAHESCRGGPLTIETK